MGNMVRLCRASELAEGSARGFAPDSCGRDRLFVVRKNGFHAYRNACPHWEGTSLPWRKDAYLNADATRIVCSAHGAQFDIDTGVCLLGPCPGQSLTRLPVMETSDGFLQIESLQ
jgi:nitrite reductase/ring-hydroxylating ferredoxin subunit